MLVVGVAVLLGTLDAVAIAAASAASASTSSCCAAARSSLAASTPSAADDHVVARLGEIGAERRDVAHGRGAVGEHAAVPVERLDVALRRAAELAVRRGQRLLGLGRAVFGIGDPLLRGRNRVFRCLGRLGAARGLGRRHVVVVIVAARGGEQGDARDDRDEAAGAAPR